MIESATGATFATQKQESPDAKVSCPSGCCRIIVLYRLFCSPDTACGHNDFCSVRLNGPN